MLSLSLLVSDTSEYPKSHTFFSYALDSNVPSKIQEIIEDIASQPPRTICDAVMKLCGKLAVAVGICTTEPPTQHQDVEMEDDDEGSDDDYEAFDAYEDFGSGSGSSANSRIKFPRLQQSVHLFYS